MASASRFSASAIVHVWSGGVNRRFTRRNPTSAAASAGASPPTVATVTTSSRNSSRTLGRLTSSRMCTSTALSAGSPTAASSHPAARRRGARAAGWRRTRGTARSPSSVSGRGEITCTSMGPDSRTTRLMTEPRTSSVTPRAVAGAEDELRGVLGAGEVDEGGGHVAAGGLVVEAAQLLEQAALVAHVPVVGHEPVVRSHVDAQQLAAGPGGDAGGPADEVVGAGRAGDGDDDPLAGLPRLGDAVPLAVLLEGVVDPVGHPQQRQLAQRRQVAGAEVVGQRGVDAVGAVDVAVGHAPAERLGRHVDQLDLVGGPDDPVGDRLALADPGDALDDVVDRLEVLDVDGGDDVDAGGEQLADVLPPLVVAQAGHVGVGELVDERHLGSAGHHGVDVHLLDRRAAVGHRPAGHDLEVGDLLRGVRPAVGLDEAHDDVGAALGPAASFVEHGERLADTGGGAEVDAQRAPGRRRAPRGDGFRLGEPEVMGSGCGTHGLILARAEPLPRNPSRWRPTGPGTACTPLPGVTGRA